MVCTWTKSRREDERASHGIPLQSHFGIFRVYAGAEALPGWGGAASPIQPLAGVVPLLLPSRRSLTLHLSSGPGSLSGESLSAWCISARLLVFFSRMYIYIYMTSLNC